MAARRRYTWLLRPENPCGYPADEMVERVREFLTESCEATPQFYSAPDVKQLPCGSVQIGLVVSAKDRWKVAWRTRNKLLPLLGLAGKFFPAHLDLVEKVPLPPHRHPNRGVRWHKPPE